MKQQALTHFRLTNFKAIKNSGVLKLRPLTVLIGSNGVGKSSLIEGLATCQAVITRDLDSAMQEWYSFEQLWNKRASLTEERLGDNEFKAQSSMLFEVRGTFATKSFVSQIEIHTVPSLDSFRIGYEMHETKSEGRHSIIERDREGNLNNGVDSAGQKPITGWARPDSSAAPVDVKLQIASWQFLSLRPDSMGLPGRSNLTAGSVTLEKDASNLARYLNSIQTISSSAYQGIVDAMSYILAYATDIQPALDSGFSRDVMMQLVESDLGKEGKIPGWLFSTGTLRVLAILAVLRHPHPPPLLVVEEIENGLDPRALRLVLEELRRATSRGSTQVIVTTHSPYFLSLLSLSDILLAQRRNGQPKFYRPANDEQLRSWSTKFDPGELYLSGNLYPRTKT